MVGICRGGVAGATAFAGIDPNATRWSAGGEATMGAFAVISISMNSRELGLTRMGDLNGRPVLPAQVAVMRR